MIKTETRKSKSQGETAAATEINMEKAKEGYFALRRMLYHRAWKYEPHDDELYIRSGIKGEDLPESFECPLCGVGKDNFSEAE